MLEQILKVIGEFFEWLKLRNAEKRADTVGDIVRRHRERELRQKDRLDRSEARGSDKDPVPGDPKGS